MLFQSSAVTSATSEVMMSTMRSDAKTERRSDGQD